ncbi:MAG: DUF3445 domain-containing protein [Acidobacteria bacterium]|nr:DUF3445 domain-containing protein [Acidobacteriota bacterium]
MEPREALVGPGLGGEPFKWHMGLRPTPEETWLQLDAERDFYLGSKTGPRRVALAGSYQGSLTLARAIIDNLAAYHGIDAMLDTDQHPIDAAGDLVQEDLCLMQRRDDSWRLIAASVHFPSGWDPRTKLGSSLAAIHEQVPRFEADLGDRPVRFLDRLPVGSVMERSVWALSETSSLAQDRGHQNADSTVVPADIYLRVERQTLRRLVEADLIAFTIRVHRWPLSHINRDVELASALIGALDSLPDDVARYKSTTARLRDSAIRYLGDAN